MLPSAGPGKKRGATPAAASSQALQPQFTRNPSANALPPSTVIRSRFRSIAERPPTLIGARGSKRYMLDDSPSAATDRAPWSLSLETPIRASSAHTSAVPLVDTLMRPQRLFPTLSPLSDAKTSLLASAKNSDRSPARSILDSAHKESENIGRLESLKRAAEKAKFELRQVELARERDREEAQRAHQRLESELLAQTKRVEKLERDRKWLFEQEERLAEQRRAVERDLSAQRSAYESRIDEMAAANRELEQQLDDASHAMRRLKSDHLDQIDDMQIRLSRAERIATQLQASEKSDALRSRGDFSDTSSLQYTIDSLKREVQSKDQDIDELKHRLKSTMPSGENCSGAADAAVIPSRERIAQLERDLHEQCDYIKAVEQQNHQLRSETRRLAEAASLYEKEHEISCSLQAKVERLEKQQTGYADMEARLTALHQEREQWTRVFHDSDSDNSDTNPQGQNLCSPFAVAKTVATQRHTIKLLEGKLQSMQESEAATMQQQQKATNDVQSYKQKCLRLESQLSAEKTKTFQLEASKQHAVREAEFLRAQLHSYDREEASFMPGNYDEQKADRIKQLEEFIDEQRAWIVSLESSTGDIRPISADGAETVSTSLLQGYREDAEAKQHELDSLHEEHWRLQERFDKLEKETARLEHQVGSGLGYNPKTTRILQLIDNPSAQDFAIRSEKLKSLAAENEALLERIRQLERSNPAQSLSLQDASQEDAVAGDASSPYFHTIDNLRTENQELAHQLEASVKLINRYKKAWKRKVSELREVIYAILGYRVDFLVNGSVRFTSTYAADLDQSFVFTSGDDDQGVMQLSGGGSKAYLKGLSNDIRYWVQERGSIPGFMATITLQSFEAQLDQKAQ
ncbi:coiled-coil domain-containing protein mad1 [Coemansia spiralis]|uniref:Spindle assembly checkpoint component MAD1 n=2 Tax=Coemansia TaxID=4863 RepID=A0A9W8FY51_9FUNG|nr:spindle assembly checkpoint component Mad1 [Coemansia spiralis]KAJ1988663.1 coiled-coil domain-containing protein mad1 [Coemansia umbellata]KAJ2619877.1 coiled-coil domain-containing protein mad1 [Coemansia sp. RSA 1358]KAJ2670795.1 coiled-coil domain-containing protein mad1 [Coemansia spiralis]